MHFRAANAITGFLDRVEGVGRFDIQAALEPSRLHEAQWHLNQAASITRDSTLRPHRTNAAPERRFNLANDRLSRLGEPFSWTQLRWSIHRSAEADMDLWLALKDHLASPLGGSLHPVEWLLAAQFARKLVRRKRSPDNANGIVADLADSGWQFIENAWRACADLCGWERQAAEFVVVTTRACFIMEADRGSQGIELARREIKHGLELLPVATSILDSEWFEFVGDAHGDHVDAARLYRKGFLNEAIDGVGGIRVEALAKYVGASLLAGRKPDQGVLERIVLSRRGWQRLRENAVAMTGLRDLPRATERWRQGRAYLLGGGDR